MKADNTAIAAFSQLEWEFNENWRTTVGLRYTDEERKVRRSLYEVMPDSLDANGGPVTPLGGGLYMVQRPGFEYNPAFSMPLSDVLSDKTNDSAVTPMASIQYLLSDSKWIDQGSFYLSYSEGFLSGGLSEAPSGQLEEFKPEEVENWEFGFKLDLLDRRLRLNGAVFYSDYKNRQLTTLVINSEASSPAPGTINAPSSTIKGFELESTWLATDNLMLSFNMTLADADIKEFEDTAISIADVSLPPGPACERADLTVLQVDACQVDRSKENLPRLAEQSYLLAAQYTMQTAMGTFMPRLQASWKLDLEFCFDPASCETGLWQEDEQFELSARLSWISPSERWIGSLYGSNLTDEQYMSGGAPLVGSQGVGSKVFAAPRMYGAELQYRF